MIIAAGTIKEANQPDKAPVGMMNGEQPVKLLMEYNLGLTTFSSCRNFRSLNKRTILKTRG